MTTREKTATASDDAPTDEQFQNSISVVAMQLSARIRNSDEPIRYALAFSLLRAASEALDGTYDPKRTSEILKAISVPVEDVDEDGHKRMAELVSIFPFDKQEEARRLGEAISPQLNFVPSADPQGEKLDTDHHRRGVTEFVLETVRNRFGVSTYWRTILPLDWDSEERREMATRAIVKVLGQMQHQQWSANRGKVIRAYLRAVGANQSLFKNIDF